VKIAKGMKVTLKVDLSVAGGQQLEKNQVEFVFGSGAMLSGLETVLEGLEKGAKREGTLKAKDAFGNPAMHPLKKMKRTEFPKDLELKIGEKLVAKGVNDMNVIMKIEKVSGDEVEVRLVHPLAEKDIKYSVEVVGVRPPPPAPPPPPADAVLELEEDK
jgi:FKBP-type peptidyl-prolyl cis-trans isomerase SlyD